MLRKNELQINLRKRLNSREANNSSGLSFCLYGLEGSLNVLISEIVKSFRTPSRVTAPPPPKKKKIELPCMTSKSSCRDYLNSVSPARDA